MWDKPTHVATGEIRRKMSFGASPSVSLTSGLHSVVEQPVCQLYRNDEIYWGISHISHLLLDHLTATQSHKVQCYKEPHIRRLLTPYT
jgi:hypothetical protein